MMGATQKRTVLVTGCSAGGAGHALALEFAARGLRVFATARSTSSLTGLAEKGIETFALDVTKAESIATLKREITARTGGKLDILYNNAGMSKLLLLGRTQLCLGINHTSMSSMSHGMVSGVNAKKLTGIHYSLPDPSHRSRPG